MWNRVFLLSLMAAVSPTLRGQGTVSVDLLDPAEAGEDIPPYLRVVDVFVDFSTSDIWTFGGIRATTAAGATLTYHDGDANTPGLQPRLIAPGWDDRFLTSIGRPHSRNARSRFSDEWVGIAGGYSPPAPISTVELEELSVGWTTAGIIENPPRPVGYVARISVDISGVPDAPADLEFWGVGTEAPLGATVVLDSRPQPFTSPRPGTGVETEDYPNLTGLNWQLWFVPEPGTIALSVLGIILIRKSRQAR